MRTLFLFFALFASTVAGLAAPPLTEDIQRDFATAVYEALGVKPTAEITRLLRSWREEAWASQNQGEIEGTLFIVERYRQIQATPQPKQIGDRALLRTAMIQNFRQNAASDPVVRRLVAIYDEAHPAIAPGTPALTRESANAWVDLMALAHTGGFQISATEREKAIRELASAYAQAGPQQQLLVFQSIYAAAKLKAEWPAMNEQDRGAWVSALRGIFLPAANGQVQQMLNQHSFQMMQNQLNFMRQNTDTIMGSPPYFDPSCNCWKQRGGIVTEYH